MMATSEPSPAGGGSGAAGQPAAPTTPQQNPNNNGPPTTSYDSPSSSRSSSSRNNKQRQQQAQEENPGGNNNNNRSNATSAPPQTSFVTATGGGSSEVSYNSRGLVDTSQNSGASSVLPLQQQQQQQQQLHTTGGGGVGTGVTNAATATTTTEPVNFGEGSSTTASPSHRSTGGGGSSNTGGTSDVFSRRVTLGGGNVASTTATQQQQPQQPHAHHPHHPPHLATTHHPHHSQQDRRNSLSSLSLMDDIFGKRASMGLGSTAALSAAMGGGANALGGSALSTAAGGPAGAGAADDLNSTAGASLVAGHVPGGGASAVGGATVTGGGGPGGGSGGSMFGRRGSMDSTTAALDAAIFDLTRRRYSMANSSLVGGGGGGGNSVVGSGGHSVVGSGGPGAVGGGGAGGGGGATINSLAGGDRSALAAAGMDGDYGAAVAAAAAAGGGTAFDASVVDVTAARRASLDMAAAAGGGVPHAAAAAGMDYGDGSGSVMSGLLPQNVSSGAGVGGMGPSLMAPGGGQQHAQPPQPYQRVRNMTSNIAARQQQLQAQQRELERRQRELEQQRRELIASMQQRKLMMHRPPPPQANQPHPLGGSGAGAGGLGGDMRYDGLLQQQQQLPPPNPHHPHALGGGHHGAGGGNFIDPLTGPYHQPSMGSAGGGAAAVAAASGVGAGQTTVPNNLSNTSDHSSRGGMGQNTQNSSGGGSSNGSQQWWICQVCNTKAFASHDEALAHEAICNKNPMAAAQQGGYGGGLQDQGFQSNYSNNSGSTPQRQRGGANVRHSARMDGSHSSSKYHGSGSGLDGSMRTVHTTATTNSYEPVFSTGPFANLEKPLPLAMPTDKDWLTPLHCFVRRHCVEVFCASEADVAAPSKGKRKPIQVGQIGIRCPHCHPNAPAMLHKMRQQQENGPDSASKARERGSVYYPTTIASIYNATMNLLQRHLHSCAYVPKEVMSRYETLKSDDARSGTSKKYWIESALSIGLVDTEMGIRFSAATPPPLPQLTDSQKNMQEHIKDQTATSTAEPGGDNHEGGGATNNKQSLLDKSDTNEAEPAPLTAPEDKSYSTAFSYHLLSQMKPCVFTEADRLGKRKGLPPGFPGLACRHCFGGYGSGRFFPSSIKTLSDTSKTLNVLHNHMIRCRKCPAEVRETLEQLRGTHDEERAKMKFGSQKAFFARIWERLHGGGGGGSNKPGGAATPLSPLAQQQHHRQQAQHSPMIGTPMNQHPQSSHVLSPNNNNKRKAPGMSSPVMKNTSPQQQPMPPAMPTFDPNKRPRSEEEPNKPGA